MSFYTIALLLLGVAILGVAWLPSLLEKYPLSHPILCILLGLGVYSLPLHLPLADPQAHIPLVAHLSELCVIVALTGTGLKIDRPFSLRAWRTPLVLVLRPLGGVLSLLGSKRVSLAERGVVSFFGIRGIGSIFYVAYALGKDEFPQARQVGAILAFTRHELAGPPLRPQNRGRNYRSHGKGSHRGISSGYQASAGAGLTAEGGQPGAGNS